MPRPNVAASIQASLDRFHGWLRRAAPGDTYTYHVGLLAADRYEANYAAPSGALSWKPVEPFHSVGLHALAAAQDGLVSLWQRRRGPAEYEYIARRTKRKD